MSEAPSGPGASKPGRRGASQDDTRWKKHTDTMVGQVNCSLGEVPLDGTFDEYTARVEVWPVGRDKVPIQVAADGEGQYGTAEVSLAPTLSADQAEALADALLESAEAAREKAGEDNAE